MTKKQIIQIRWKTWDAWCVAFNSGIPCCYWNKTLYDSHMIIVPKNKLLKA